MPTAGAVKLAGTSLATLGLTMLRAPQVWFPDTRRAVFQPGQGDRAFVGQGFASPRRFKLACLIEGTSLANLRSRIDSINVLMPGTADERNTATLELLETVWEGRVWDVYAAGGIGGTQYGFNLLDVTLDFIAPDPIARGLTLVENVLVIFTNPDTLTTGVIAGTAPAPAIYTVERASGSGSVSFSITNDETGGVFYWVGTMATGDIVRLDTYRRAVEKSTDAGVTWASAMTGVGNGSTRDLYLVNGIANDITIAGFSGGNAEIVVSHYPRYL